MWEKETETKTNETTDYLNVALHVADDVTINMPLNCPVSQDIRGMSGNQRKLMELLQAKIDAAMELPEGDERDEALTIQVPVTLKLYRKGSKEVDTSDWAVKL